jgi:UDP-N-acetylmuramate dehydrogenase
MMTNAECGFAYRTSIFKRQPGMIVLSATLQLKPGQGVEAGRALMQRFVLDKKAKQPVESYSAGCVFTNWKPNNEQEMAVIRKCLDLNKEEVVPFTSDGAIPAGWIIDRAQLKGMKVGHVSISDKHGNFFVSDGQARASEVIALTSAVKMKIRDMTEGIIMLLDEIEYVGF